MANSMSLTRLLEVNNARNLTRDEIVQTFVPPPAYWRLLSPKNHVLLGSRGSGKTAIAKMLSHSHLRLFNHPSAKQIINAKELIGLYVPARLSWLSSQIEKTLDEKAAKDQFVWKLNLATTFGLLDAVESCLQAYFLESNERALRESNICERLSKDWLCERSHFDLASLRRYVIDLDYAKKTKYTECRLGLADEAALNRIGVAFHLELFEPLKRGIDSATQILDLPHTAAWLVCLDEIEFLELYHHELINSHMRADSGRLYFKCTTLPYRHYTKGTTTALPINEKHDFEYEYLDQDIFFQDHSHLDQLPQFMSAIYDKRFEASGHSVTQRKTLSAILGRSRLIDDEPIDWSRGSHYYELMQKYCNDLTLLRANRYLEKGQQDLFNSRIGRKIAPALKIRSAVELLLGRDELDIYSGLSVVARCADGNPRMFLSLLNRMLLQSNKQLFDPRLHAMAPKPIRANVQNKILAEFSRSEFEKLQSEEHGKLLYGIIGVLGNKLKAMIFDRKIGTDFVSSFSVQFGLDKELDRAIKSAVAIGSIFPSVNPKDPNRMPETGGVFHLGFKFAPHFKIIPRKGKSISLEAALLESDLFGESDNQFQLFSGRIQ